VRFNQKGSEATVGCAQKYCDCAFDNKSLMIFYRATLC